MGVLEPDSLRRPCSGRAVTLEPGHAASLQGRSGFISEGRKPCKLLLFSTFSWGGRALQGGGQETSRKGWSVIKFAEGAVLEQGTCVPSCAGVLRYARPWREPGVQRQEGGLYRVTA